MDKQVIVCAGMHRSGSTWLYNAVRLIIASSRVPVYACWVNKYKPDDGRKIHVVKTHLFYPKIREAADCIFTTRRDLRDVAASAVRKGICRSTPMDVLAYLTRIIDEDYIPWMQSSDFEVPYEDMIRDEPHFIEVLAAFMGFSVDGGEIKAEIDALDPDDPEALLSPGHITRREPGTFAETLGLPAIRAVETAFQGWQEQRGYSRRHGPS